MVRNVHHAEDIVQNTFLKVWIRRKHIDPHKSFNNYLYTITRNEITDYFRAEYRFSVHEALREAGDAEATNDSIMSAVNVNQIKDILDRQVATMPAQRKTVFMLSRAEGLSSREIADRLGISKRTVERHLNIALKSLREVLGDFHCWLLAFYFLFDPSVFPAA